MDELRAALRDAALEKLSAWAHSTDADERVFALSVMSLLAEDGKAHLLNESYAEFATTVRYAAEDAGYDIEQPPDQVKISDHEALRRIARALAILSRIGDQQNIEVFTDKLGFREPSQNPEQAAAWSAQQAAQDAARMAAPERPTETEIAASLGDPPVCTCGVSSPDPRYHMSACPVKQRG